jgi:hypothetical protein
VRHLTDNGSIDRVKWNSFTGPGNVAEYRAYLLNKVGRISQPATIIVADTDEEAIKAANQLAGTDDIALWQGNRSVTTLKRRA